MISAEIEHKLRVFISSKCGGKYTITRKALKKLFDATGLITTYVFEKEPASSLDTKSAYLDYVDESNICVFLIDNKDGIPNPVLDEQKRAKEKSVNLIYIFCDERKKTPTKMQEEIRNSLSEKYFVVHEFSDIVSKAYDSVLQDLISNYKHKKVLTSDIEDKEKGKVSTSIEKNTIDKEVYDGFSRVKDDLVGLFFHYPDEIKSDNNPLENSIFQLLKFILKLEDLNNQTISTLKNNVMKQFDKCWESFFELRFSAFNHYFNDELEACCEDLRSSLKESIDNDSIPNWVSNDVAIDLLNVLYDLQEKQGKITFKNEGQTFIENNTEHVYYPILDRAQKDIYEKISQKYFDYINLPPYSIQFGGDDVILRKISVSFGISATFGSITHCNLVLKQIVDCLYLFFNFNPDHNSTIELFRILLIQNEAKKLEKIFNNFSIDKIVNNNDIKRIRESILLIKNPLKQIKARCLLINKFGDYFEDKDFKKESEYIHKYSLYYLANDRRLGNLWTSLFGFYRSNVNRINPDFIAHLIQNVIDNSLASLYNDICILIEEIEYTYVNIDIQQYIASVLSGFIESSIDIPKLNWALIEFCKYSSIDNTDLEKKISLHMEEFYKTTFYLEVHIEDQTKLLEHVYRYLEQAKLDNLTQSKNIGITECSTKPLEVIKNILIYDSLKLTNKQVDDLLAVALDILLNPWQNYKTKISAIKLVNYLYCTYTEYASHTSIKNIILSAKEKIMFSELDNSYDYDSSMILNYACNLFVLVLENMNSIELTDYILSIDDSACSDLIETLKISSDFLKNGSLKYIPKYFLTSLVHLAMIYSNHTDKNVRFRSVELLILLTGVQDYQGTILKRLSKIMDEGSYESKITILTRLGKISTTNQDYIDYIIKKGLVDNNYEVRMYAKREQKRLD